MRNAQCSSTGSLIISYLNLDASSAVKYAVTKSTYLSCVYVYVGRRASGVVVVAHHALVRPTTESVDRSEM
jgi:hypothetical protein